ncbi:UNVERIFIED_CONTAM: Retrovirus-related Pol polyprotein from transposon.6 [Sesamum latifolium]|uniref:Retrovirus-related Pol polyprotein from transposon.6 n=1 Tax=Sesamum latifolium TaxID=2727402 RepID=A0AAW2UTR7_9LAMI
MPFGLKNIGATYQHLVDRMFREQLGHNMKVYVDDMLVKSRQMDQHLTVLAETFNTLRKYHMKLKIQLNKHLECELAGLQGKSRTLFGMRHANRPAYLAELSLLTKLTPCKPLYLYLVVGQQAVSSVLIKDEDGYQKPVYYVSKVLHGSSNSTLR